MDNDKAKSFLGKEGDTIIIVCILKIYKRILSLLFTKNALFLFFVSNFFQQYYCFVETLVQK